MRPDQEGHAGFRLALGLGLVALALVPPLAGRLEASLATHILGQYPLLVGGGALIGATLARRGGPGWTAGPALLGGMLALVFWLLPRWIDAAVARPAAGAAKAVTLVFLAGLPLGWGWALAGPVLRGFAWADAASMLAVMGWLQLSVPQRLCNSYLLTDQARLGQGALALAALVVAAGAARLVIGGGEGRHGPGAGRDSSPGGRPGEGRPNRAAWEEGPIAVTAGDARHAGSP